MSNTPEWSTACVVITRDRVSMTRQCVASLERHSLGRLDIHIVDHGSTYGPMLDYLRASPHHVIRRGDFSPRSLWEWDGLRRLVSARRYLVTDPDLVFDDACPGDWLDVLAGELDHAGQGARKAGMGLRIDNLPDTELARAAQAWERPFWACPTSDRRAYWAPVDTTLALYQGLDARPDFSITPALRLAAPYLVRHLPWYASDDERHDEETEHYRAHALPGTSHWINGGW